VFWRGRMHTVMDLLGDSQDGSTAASLLSCSCALACAIFFAPLLLCVYLLVRTDGGPAFVGDEHVRQDGTSVSAWRFRTVHWGGGAEGGWAAGSRGRDEGSVPEIPEFTAAGRLLRGTRIDTLPLLYNVVRGELSFFDMLHEI